MGFLAFLKELINALFMRPNYQEPVIQNSINMEPVKTNKEKLADIANSYIGKDASPKNLAPKELSCAEGVSNIIQELYSDFPSSVLSTAELDHFLTKSTHFAYTKFPRKGCVINSPRNASKNGHCGIYVTDTEIASNDSSTGRFERNYTIDSWVKEMRGNRDLKIYFYEPI